MSADPTDELARVERSYRQTTDQPPSEGRYQRFEGSFSDDGTRITARWEGSRDGKSWTPDFGVTYTKVS